VARAFGPERFFVEVQRPYERGDVRRVPRQVQGERSMVAEAIERATARDCAHEVPVLALVEERAGLLARPGRGEEFHAVLVHLDLARDVTVQDNGLARQAFLRSQWHIVPRQDPRRLDERAQRGEDLFPETLESCAS